MEFWEDYFEPHILARGRVYYNKGKVKGYTQNEDGCMARVLGTNIYTVKISGLKSKKPEFLCNCPYAGPWTRCKHEAAVLFAWEENNQGTIVEQKLADSSFESNKGKTFYNVKKILDGCRLRNQTLKEAMELVKDNKVKLEKASLSYGSQFLDGEMIITFYGTYQETEDAYAERVSVSFNREELTGSACSAAHKDRVYYSYNSYGNFKGHDIKNICPHQAALLLLADKYIARYNPGDATDLSGQNILNGFKSLVSFQKIDQNLEMRKVIRLEPTLVYNAYRQNELMELSFKIGVDRMYVLKDLTALVDARQKFGQMTFGKKGHISFVSEDFDDASLSLYNLIEKRVEKIRNNIKKMGARNPFAYIGDIVKERLPLSDEYLDEFFDLYNGKQIDLKDEYGETGIDGGKIKLSDGKVKIELNMRGFKEDDNGASGLVIGGYMPELISGNAHSYCISSAKKALLRVEDLSPMVSLLAENVDNDNYVEFTIGQKNTSEFYYRLLPMLEECPEIELVEEDTDWITEILPPEGKISFYMDADSDHVYGKAAVKYGDAEEIILHELRDEDYPLPESRDIALEQTAVATLKKYLPDYNMSDDNFACERSGDNVFEILSNGIRDFMAIGEVNGSKDFERLKIRKAPQVKLGVSLESGILNLEITTDDMSEEELLELLDSYRKKKKFYRLRNGEFIRLEQDDTIEQLAFTMEAMGVTAKEFTKGKLHLPLYRALYINKLLEEHDEIAADRDKNFKSLVRDFNAVKDADVELPVELNGVLRGYQRYGFRWLYMLSELGFGGILADDMGLGKTLQVIALLLARRNEAREKNESFTALVVCPASLVYNWEEEIKRFAGSLKVKTVTGTQAERKELLSAKKLPEILVTSYDLLKRDIGMYEQLEFNIEIIDEAQFIKNASAAAAKAVKIINSKRRFALTGTPIENRLSELWSIFDYLMPGFLYTYDRFKSDFETQITKYKDEETTRRLKNMVGPFILRRLKEDVLKDLPEKMEEVRYSKFEPDQRKLYDAQVTHMRRMLESQEYNSGQDRIKVLAELTRIRQICCDPALITAGYKGESAKRASCLELVESAIDGGHKILLFSQFTSMLELLEKDFKKAGIEYYKITGQTSKEDRIKLVHAFNENEVPLFLISLKAGGTGLNLVGADVVIHYDPWWNLAAQNQATDRAHRIGQTKKVSVFKLIAKDTIEEKIVEMQNAKKDLADAILSGESESLMNLTKDQLMELLG